MICYLKQSITLQRLVLVHLRSILYLIGLTFFSKNVLLLRIAEIGFFDPLRNAKPYKCPLQCKVLTQSPDPSPLKLKLSNIITFQPNKTKN